MSLGVSWKRCLVSEIVLEISIATSCSYVHHGSWICCSFGPCKDGQWPAVLTSLHWCSLAWTYGHLSGQYCYHCLGEKSSPQQPPLSCQRSRLSHSRICESSWSTSCGLQYDHAACGCVHDSSLDTTPYSPHGNRLWRAGFGTGVHTSSSKTSLRRDWRHRGRPAFCFKRVHRADSTRERAAR